MDVDSAKHFSHTEFTGWPKTTATIPMVGIPVRAEKHVPDRKIGIVEGVYAFLVMYAVAFRALKEISEPTRSLHVPVINQFGQATQDDGAGRGTRFDAYPEIQNETH